MCCSARRLSNGKEQLGTGNLIPLESALAATQRFGNTTALDFFTVHVVSQDFISCSTYMLYNRYKQLRSYVFRVSMKELFHSIPCYGIKNNANSKPQDDSFCSASRKILCLPRGNANSVSTTIKIQSGSLDAFTSTLSSAISSTRPLLVPKALCCVRIAS